MIEWKTDRHGDIVMTPVSGWRSATLPENCVLLAIEIVPSAKAPRTGERDTHQMALTREQARQLGQLLLEMASAPHIGQPYGRA